MPWAYWGEKMRWLREVQRPVWSEDGEDEVG